MAENILIHYGDMILHGHLRKPGNAVTQTGAGAGCKKRTEKNIHHQNQKSELDEWAWHIKKVYSVDPLSCPKCGSDMKIHLSINTIGIRRSRNRYVQGASQNIPKQGISRKY